MEILVFKTNAGEQHLSHLNQCLGNIPGIAAWDCDLEDIDRILRVKTAHVPAAAIERVLQGAGYQCIELAD